MKKMLMLSVLFSCALSVFAAGKKDVILVDNPDKPHYGEGGGSGVANLPIDAPEITPDMVGDTTQLIGETQTIKGTVKIATEGNEQVVYVSTGLFSKVPIVFVKGFSELTVEDFLALEGKKVTLYGWYANDKKSFTVLEKDE